MVIVRIHTTRILRRLNFRIFVLYLLTLSHNFVKDQYLNLVVALDIVMVMEMHKQKTEREAREAEMQRIIETSDELKELEHKIKRRK